jgi:hypothetical protein
MARKPCIPKTVLPQFHSTAKILEHDSDEVKEVQGIVLGGV